MCVCVCFCFCVCSSGVAKDGMNLVSYEYIACQHGKTVPGAPWQVFPATAILKFQTNSDLCDGFCMFHPYKEGH